MNPVVNIVKAEPHVNPIVKAKEVRTYHGTPEVVAESVVLFRNAEHFESFQKLCKATNRICGLVTSPPDGMLKSVSVEVMD